MTTDTSAESGVARADDPSTASERAAHFQRLYETERAARLEAEAQRARLEAIVRDHPAAVVFMHGRNLVVTVANDEFRRLAGDGDPTGLPFARARIPLIPPGTEGQVESVYATGQRVDFREVPVTVRADGEEHTCYFNTTADPIRTSEGVVEGVVLYAVDVTDQVLTREEIAHSEERFEAQYRATPIPTYTWQQVGDDWILAAYNEAAERATGGAIRSLVGVGAREFYRNKPDILADLERCTRERSRFTREIRYGFVSTGIERDLIVSYAFVPPDLVMIHTEDVTERLRAEAERDRLLAEASAQAAEREATLGQIIDGIVIADAQGSITFLNDAGKRILGTDEIGVPLEQHAATYFTYRPDGTAFPTEELPLSRAILRGETVVNDEVRIRRPGTREIVLSSSATPLVAEDGSKLGAVATFRDVTAERELEREKEDFLAAAAHDLKTPLTTIKGVAQLLERRAQRAGSLPAEEIQRQIERIDTTASKMNALIGTLLDLTRLELNHPLDLVLSPADLVAIVRQVVGVQRFSDRHRVIVRAAEEHLHGEWDVARLERVVANLVTNAVKYSPAGGDVYIDLGRDGECAVLSVTDSGLGVPAEDLPRIFERFFRARNVIDEVAGAGIGLAACKRIVEQHGGELVVESEEGVGSTFTVRLPLQEP